VEQDPRTPPSVFNHASFSCRARQLMNSRSPRSLFFCTGLRDRTHIKSTGTPHTRTLPIWRRRKKRLKWPGGVVQLGFRINPAVLPSFKSNLRTDNGGEGTCEQTKGGGESGPCRRAPTWPWRARTWCGGRYGCEWGALWFTGSIWSHRIVAHLAKWLVRWGRRTL